MLSTCVDYLSLYRSGSFDNSFLRSALKECVAAILMSEDRWFSLQEIIDAVRNESSILLLVFQRNFVEMINDGYIDVQDENYRASVTLKQGMEALVLKL